jgi:putative solute:sodium symporter small subunit
MTGTSDRQLAALLRHWASNRRWVVALTALWGLITFVPPFFARELSFEVFGAPLPV